MYRSLLAVFICLSLLLASGDTAYALKDPDQIKVLPGTLPGAPKAGAEFNVAVPEMPPQYSKPISAALRADVTGIPYRNPSDCTPISYWDGTPYWYWPIPDDYGDDFFNMRFTPHTDENCRLATVALCFYDAGSTVITGSGIDIILWDDDGYGFPGAELARINVPAADMIWFPWYVVVDFTPFDFHFMNEDFHVGYTTVDQANDVYAVLSDEGVLGTLRSYEYYLGLWGTMYNDWGLDVNFIIEADVCCTGGSIANCALYNYGTYSAYYYWTIPDSYGDDFFNERFTNVSADPGTLGTAFLSMHLEGSVDVTGEGVDVIVWDNDGLGLPGTELARVNIPTSQMAWYPEELEVDFRPFGLVISAGQDFHIGYTTVNQGAGNVMALLSDDGSGPAEYRSSEYWNGIWGLMIDDWGVDVDFLIAAELCFGDPMPPPVCDWISYNGDAYYFWTIPDAYGDDYFNVRFTSFSECSLAALEIAFYADGSVGSPGADFILFNSNGTYPTDTIAVYSVNPVTTWFPGYEHADCSADNITVTGEFHLGYSPIYNDPNDVLACLSDDGSMGTLRSGENWAGYWGLMIDDWGVDVNFLMQVNVCCLINGWEPCVDDGEWPTLAHDYHRTGYNPIQVGDLCGFQRIWDYWSPYDWCYFANPIIADEKVYAVFGVHLVCLDVYTGAEIWNTAGVSAYGNILGGSLRSTPTFEYGANDTNYVYFGGGSFESFLKADASTGQVHWYRGGIGGVPLEGTPGTMRMCPSVIIDDYIYFGGDGGYIYKLNKHTGSTAAFTETLYGNPVWVSPSTDGHHLYFGCSASAIGGDAGYGNNEGALYKYDSYLNLIAPYSGNIGWDEGVTVGAAYNSAEDALYFQVQCAQGHGDPWNVDGFTQKADASTMGPHEDNTFYMCGLGTNANPAINPYARLVFFGHSTPRYRTWYTGISCMSASMNPLWNDFTRGDMTNPAAVSCDYVLWGTRDHPNGTFNCSRLYDGEHMLGYELTGYGFGPAIAKYETDPGQYQVFIAQTQLWSDCGTGGGRLAMYSSGEPRGRLQIPSREVVIDPAIDFTDPDGTERTAELFCNNGCAGLKYCLRLEADPGFPTRTLTSHVNPHRMARVEKEADKLIEYSIDDFGGRREWKQAMMKSTPMGSEIGDRPTGMKSRETYTASAPPSWVTMLSPDEGMVRVVDCYEATFAFDVSSMVRGNNWFYVWIATDDPDYSECELVVNDCSAPPYEVNTYVRVNAILGFAFCEGYLDFGDGGDDYEYVNNGGWFDDGTVTDAFTVDGGGDPLYEGSFYWAVDSNRVAWVEEGGDDYAHLFADTVCTLTENMYMAEMYNSNGDSTSIFGDYFEAAVVDSIYDQTTGELDDALTVGMRLSYREWGAFGVPFNNFKLIAYDLCNRNSDPVNDLYWGLFADWDMPGHWAGYEQVNGDLSIGVAYQYNEVSGELAGYGTLPMAGSSPDGYAFTTGMYNGYGIHNPYQVYTGALPDIFFILVDECPGGEWCYHPQASPGSTPDDRSMILTAGKKSFSDTECVSGAYVVFYYPLGISMGEIEDMMKFANKWAGYDRGDLNNDGEITLNDLVTLILYLNGGKAPYPFLYLADVDADGDVDYNDAVYFYNFFFEHGPYPLSKLIR